jgi:hypothetical protein
MHRVRRRTIPDTDCEDHTDDSNVVKVLPVFGC